jgi:hypothetical protein
MNSNGKEKIVSNNANHYRVILKFVFIFNFEMNLK